MDLRTRCPKFLSAECPNNCHYDDWCKYLKELKERFRMITCPCCENPSTQEQWYELSNDDFYICPVCRNTCTKDEIESKEGI